MSYEIKNIDYKKFIEDNFAILDYERQTPVPFRFDRGKDKRVQDIYNDILTEEYPTMEGVREIILKARREGMSSLVLAYFTVDFLLRPYSVSICISHKRDVTELLFRQVKFYLESFIEKQNKKHGTNLVLADYLETETKGMIVNRLNKATFYIGTAGSKVGGRGGYATNLHFCVGKNTKILLPSGNTSTIENIQKSDWIIAEDGSWTEVTNKWNTGIKQMKRIRLWYGNETIDVSVDHKIRVMNEVGEPTWKKANELTTRDFVLWAYPLTNESIKQSAIQPQKNAIHLTKTLYENDYKLGYFLGYYLAEGNISKNLNRISFTCEKNEDFYKTFLDLFPIQPNIKLRENRKVITYNSKELAMFVENLVGRVKGKHVHKYFLWQYPRKFLKGLYEGWRDGDGSKTQKNFVSIASVHEKIARQMRQVYAIVYQEILALDYYKDRERYGIATQPVYLVREYGNKKNRERKQITKNGEIFIRIKKIEDIEPQQTYEIEVAHPSHSYLTVCGVVSNSEAAFYADTEMITAEEMISGTAQQVPLGKGKIFIESTANGEGNYYHGEWQRAYVDKISSYKPRFFGWELFYTKEQVEQRRKEFSSDSMWKQEYPRTPEDAFRVTGTPFFDMNVLQAMADAKAPMIAEGRFAADGEWV